MMKEPVGFVGGEAGMFDYSNFVCHNQLLSDDVVESVKNISMISCPKQKSF